MKFNNNRSAIFIALFLWFLPFGLLAQQHCSPTIVAQKKHQFGLGASTALFDHNGSINHYLQGVGYSGHAYSLQTAQSAFVSLFFDYQFRFNDRWSIETRLKYNRHYIIQTLSFVSEGYYGLVGSLNSVYRDIALPVTVNFRCLTHSGSSLESFVGLGLTTNGLSTKNPITIGLSDTEGTQADIGIEYFRTIDVFGVVGFQFDIPFGVLVVKPFLSYSFSPRYNAQFFVTPMSPTSTISCRNTSAPMRLSELECGLIVQF